MSISFAGSNPPLRRESATSGLVIVGWRCAAWSCCFFRYPEKSRLRPRSKTRFVVFRLLFAEGDGCWMRKDREGTVVRIVGEVSVMNRYSGRVKWPPSRADIVTYFWSADGGGRERI